jgi:hypothetical protein
MGKKMRESKKTTMACEERNLTWTWNSEKGVGIVNEMSCAYDQKTIKILV